MQVGSTRSHSLSHQPLSALSKSSIAGLVGVAVFSILIWLVIRAVPFFFLIIALMLICAALISVGIRWMPFAASTMCACFLYALLVSTPFAFAHFQYPKGNGSNPWLSFEMFVIVAGFVWCLVMTTWTGISAGIQNYRQQEQLTTPRWFPFVLAGMIGLLIGSLLIAAIEQPASAIATPAPVSTTTSSTTTNSTTTSANKTTIIHMGTTNFGQATVTIAKGGKVELVNDGSYYHSISAGSWVNGQPVVQHETNEPAVKDVVINGTAKSVVIGPFATAGTYHLLCTVHPGMTLTIIVR